MLPYCAAVSGWECHLPESSTVHTTLKKYILELGVLALDLSEIGIRKFILWTIKQEDNYEVFSEFDYMKLHKYHMSFSFFVTKGFLSGFL